MARAPLDSATKRQLAIIQMRRAILLLGDGDFICALTLAGAAEESANRPSWCVRIATSKAAI